MNRVESYHHSYYIQIITNLPLNNNMPNFEIKKKKKNDKLVLAQTVTCKTSFYFCWVKEKLG